MHQRLSGEAYRVTRVCVDSYQDGVLKGRFYNPAAPKGRSFESLSQFLLGLDGLYNDIKLPQSFNDMRGFSGHCAKLTDMTGKDNEESVAERTGALATFSIKLLYRQHSSWQGTLLWCDGRENRPFRSVLELVALIDSALSEG